MTNTEHSTTREIPWRVLLKPHWLLLGFLMLLGLLRGALELIPTSIEIGPDTTVLDGPVRPDGTIDYTAVIEAEWSKDSVPEENAMVDLMRAFGPEWIYEADPDEYFEKLGITEATDASKMFVSLETVLAEHGLDQYTEESVEKSWALDVAETRPWSADEFPLLMEWLDHNQVPLAHVMNASQRSQFYAPIMHDDEVASLYGWRLPESEMISKSIELLVIQAMHDIAKRDIDSAIEHTLAAHRLSSLSATHPTLLMYVSHYRRLDPVMDAYHAILQSDATSLAQIEQLRHAIREIPATGDPIHLVDTTNRYSALDLIQTTFAHGMPEEYGTGKEPSAGTFDPNPALRLVNETYDEIVAAMQIDDRRQRVAAIDRCDVRISKLPSASDEMLLLGRVMGSRATISHHYAKEFVETWVSGADYLKHFQEQETAYPLVIDTGFAIERYRTQQGEYPRELADLVPHHMDQVPIDPFTGNPLQYRLTGESFLVYSVGPDELDDDRVGPWEADDIAFGDRPREEE